ncbi:MAG: InlB B-repeat-containing protein, partial [Spirochaetaceae bacterium]|nr:InlB B-repeat-containing protein [Spirochaetaceae bacterium]
TTVVTLPTPPTKIEFVFEGWFTSTNGGGTEFTSTTTVNGNITVYAYWTPKPYNVGDVGPAGGVVFYDKGFISGGWRYLEAAPTDRNNHISINSGNGTVWGSVFIDITGANDTGIGDGETNTAAIITGTGLEMNYAARYADEYSLNGYTDWFLPSKDELNLMYTLRTTIGNFFDYLYWSSSQDPLDKRYALHQNFSNGSQSSSLMKDNWNTKIRYIRAF